METKSNKHRAFLRTYLTINGLHWARYEGQEIIIFNNYYVEVKLNQ